MTDHPTLLPRTRPGRWSLAFFVLALAGLTAMMVSMARGQRGGDSFAANWWISAPALFAAASAMCGLLAGAVAILRRRERAVSVLAAVAVGAIALLFVLGEAASPH